MRWRAVAAATGYAGTTPGGTTTFDPRSIDIEFGVDAPARDPGLDLGGNVFGVGDPDPLWPSSISMPPVHPGNDPLGDYTAGVDEAGHLRGRPAVPGRRLELTLEGDSPLAGSPEPTCRSG
jgi:hypothetical protein